MEPSYKIAEAFAIVSFRFVILVFHVTSLTSHGADLRWYFQVRVATAERASSRVLQVLETQRVTPDRFEARRCHAAMHIQFLVSADPQQASRIGWLLRRAFAVESAYWLALEGPESEQRLWQKTALASRSETESPADTDPASPWWKAAPSTVLLTDNAGVRPAEHDTEVRMRWTADNLYLLFDCTYLELHLRPEAPTQDQPTARLWEHDVAELFLGNGADPMQRYTEFEVSPRGEWIDLDITARDGEVLSTAPLHSGFAVAAELRFHEHRWRAFMRVPLAAFAESGTGDLRLNLFRSQGPRPVELAWQPTHHVSFHVPSSFGYLRLLPD